MSKELESLFPELSSAPDLACRGLEKVWSPEKGDWTWVPVYELSGVLQEQEVRARKDSKG